MGRKEGKKEGRGMEAGKERLTNRNLPEMALPLFFIRDLGRAFLNLWA